MACEANSDVCFLQDEKFDFDVSLSPASSKGEEEEEDEVFVGVVSHKERRVSDDASSRLEDGGCDGPPDWTPLTGDLLDAVCEEAHRLASQLQGGEPRAEGTSATQPTSAAAASPAAGTEEFTQDPEVKLGMLGRAAGAPGFIKRQTFCVQDSPLKQLPPAIQRQQLRAGRTSSGHPAARLSASSPMVGARPPSRTTLRGKATLGAAGVLPSRPVAPAASRSACKSGPDKARLRPPSRTAGVLRQSPSSRPINRAESSEDLLSDSVSVASDTSDCSLNSSLLGKRTLAPPSKSAGLRRLSGAKVPPAQSRRPTDRKNTSSSSSSLSSFNTSLSPAKGKLNRSLSSSVGPGSVSREPGLSRTRRSTISSSAGPLSSSTASRSQPNQAKKLLDGERAKATRSTSLKRVESTPIQPTPPKRVLERAMSVGSVRLLRSKPAALVHSTPSLENKGVECTDGGSKVMKPKGLSVSTADSRPQKLPAGSLTPSVGGCKPVAARRPSGLPTPVKRRTSTLLTPSSQTRTFRPPSTTDSSISHTLTSAEKAQRCSPAPKGKEEEEPVHIPDIQPFCLEEEDPPATLPASGPETKPGHITHVGALTVSEPIPTGGPLEPEMTEGSAAKTQEVLLLDLPPPTLQPQEKLLIDLANTPELIRTNSKSCTTTQLIDLSSPLIKWSPEEKKENNAPLINLSF